MSYRPAQCNIGRRQRYWRAALACVSFLVAVGIVVAYAVGALPGLLLIGVFAPLALAFEFGIQAYESFCVTLALLGKYDFADESGRVTDPTNRRDDRRYALRISAVSVALAALLTVALVAFL
ncbi:hypothetical protein [Haloplanus sp. C73]|uniref:hypothetical protein n=1 Tax=Haloplanus sp. C73 TaxID=3421641 RepID=UPI003EC03B20